MEGRRNSIWLPFPGGGDEKMKLKTNFYPSLGRLAAPLNASLWIITALALLAVLWLVEETGRLERELPALRRREAGIREKRLQVTEKKGWEGKEFAGLLRRVERLNEISGNRAWSPGTMLTSLESILPDEAYLIRIDYRHLEGSALLLAESKKLASLTRFLFELERAPFLSKVNLIRQGQHSIRGEKRVRYEMRVFERRGE